MEGGESEGNEQRCKKTKVWKDHDHETGQFRGWICDYCNTICARAYDDPSILEANARALREFRL